MLDIKPRDIKTVRDMRRFVGIYKTFLPAMSGLSTFMESFDAATGGKESKVPVKWDEKLLSSFKDAQKAAEVGIKSLALPAVHKQLILSSDAAVAKPAIGFVLFVARQIEGIEKHLPVFFYSCRLKDYHKKWWPCEVEYPEW